jgi:hypothetical protein
MAGVSAQDAGVAGGLVNVAHHLGGALGLGVLVTIFDAAGAGAHGRDLLADRVSAALTAACILLILALVVTAVARRRSAGEPPALAATATPAHPAVVGAADSFLPWRRSTRSTGRPTEGPPSITRAEEEPDGREHPHHQARPPADVAERAAGPAPDH